MQFDMHVAEEIGFDKFDILSQKGIAYIDDTVKLIKKNHAITEYPRHFYPSYVGITEASQLKTMLRPATAIAISCSLLWGMRRSIRKRQ
ncbi:hypothetical protein FUA48_09845 [Flavobacterium alkalisoli]|uniref:Uncharacterized protein n=1 Tax=Flavobacterium alkalisoli TaxID=2602769 RepID=A0A5B9FRA5_9FLAO|nr:hypothetical protein FUA48_09845 [Flavobacterium alkalisoli]